MLALIGFLRGQNIILNLIRVLKTAYNFKKLIYFNIFNDKINYLELF